MKKFVRNILIFVLILTAIVVSVDAVYEKRWGGSDYENEIATLPAHVQICDFGSSHALYGYNYEDLTAYDTYNFGMSSQSLSYDYRLFEEYGDHIGEGTVVFITVSYFSLFGKSEIYDDDFESKNKRYYDILSPSRIKKYNFVTDVMIHRLPVLSETPETIVRTILHGRPVDPNKGTDWLRVASDINVKEDAETAFGRHIGAAKYFDADGNRIVNQEELDALYSLIRGCQENGAVPILVTTPYLREYTDVIAENARDFMTQYDTIVQQVVTDTGVPYYDYSRDSRFMDNYGWFMNADHLNKEGARNFTDILLRETCGLE